MIKIQRELFFYLAQLQTRGERPRTNRGHLLSTVPVSVIRPKDERSKPRKINSASKALTTVSLLCLLLIAAFTFLYESGGEYQSRQPIVLIFTAICFFGTIAAVLPSKCSRIFHDRQTRHRDSSEEDRSARVDERSRELRGHHPACGRFAAHVLQVRGKIYCAGCMGLLTGALMAIAGSFTYSLGIYTVAGEASLVFWTGFVFVMIGLIQYAKPLMTNGWVHYLSNTIFVAGAFLLLLGVAEISKSLPLEIYFLIIVLYWILNRIVLSNLEHQKTCFQCGPNSCVFHSD